MPEPETRPLNLEPVAAPVHDSPEAHPASEVKEGPTREDREADARVGGEKSQRLPDRRGEPRRVGPAD